MLRDNSASNNPYLLLRDCKEMWGFFSLFVSRDKMQYLDSIRGGRWGLMHSFTGVKILSSTARASHS